MELGAFAMFDALGTRGIWEKHDAALVVSKMERIQASAQKIIESDFGGPGHPNTASADNFVKLVRAGFVSDTVVIAFANKGGAYPVFSIMMAARYASEIGQLALAGPAPWAYRGVITYGRFAIGQTGSFFVGPAVDEAACWYEQADGAFIWLAPSALAEMRHANSSDFQGATTSVPYKVPLKSSDPQVTYVASPFRMNSSPEEATRHCRELLATFDTTRPRVETKLENTRTFLDEHLREHEREWRKRQEFIRASVLNFIQEDDAAVSKQGGPEPAPDES